MSIERALTALETIAAALATIAAINTGDVTPLIAGAQPTPADVVDKTQPVAEKPTRTRSRPAAGEVVKATGIKDSDKAVATIVAEALFGDQNGAAPGTLTPEPMDYEILKRAVLEVGSYSEQGRQAVIKMLGEHGVKNAKEIAPEAREEFHAALLEVLTDLQNSEAAGQEEFA